MKLILFLLLQSIYMPPRASLENPAVTLEIPRNLQKDFDKAWARFLTGREDQKVIKDLDKLLRRHRTLDAALMAQAYLDLYYLKYPEAQEKFETVLARWPENLTVLYYTAELAYAHGDYARASGLYARLLQLDGTRRLELEPKRQKTVLLATEDLLREAASAEQEGRLQAAEQAYRQALEIGPNEPAFHGRLALVLANQDKPNEALIHLRKQLELGGPADEVQRRIAETLMELGRTEEAREILTRMREAGSGNEALETRAGELEDLGRWGTDTEYFYRIKAAEWITREELSAMIVRYFPQIIEFRQTPRIVTDIQESWARPEIQTIVGVGLIDLLPNHTFRPSDPVTRADLARSMARLSRLLGLASSPIRAAPAADLATGNALYTDIQLVLSYGLMALDEAGNFDAAGMVSGELAVQVIDRLMTMVASQRA